jgi:hypothetical protein
VGVRDTTIDGRGGCICAYHELPLDAEVNDCHYPSNRTHAKDLKNPIKVQPPGGDHLSVVLRVKASKYRTPFVPLDQFSLDICHRPVVESISVGGSKIHPRSNSQRQLIYRIVHGWTELVLSLSLRPLVKCSTDIGAG